MVEPDDVTDDICWEPVSFVCIHPPILSISVSLLGTPVDFHLKLTSLPIV
jgi:hypothetical protein